MPRRHRRTISFISTIIILAGLAIGLLYGLPQSHAESNDALTSGSKGNEKKTQQQASEEYGKLPLSFVENKGQTDARVKFMSGGSGYSLFLTANEAVLVLTRAKGKQAAGSIKAADATSPSSQRPATEEHVLRMEMVGANKNPRLTGSEELPGKVNYLIGSDSSQWQTNLPTFAKVHYEEVYPGINLVYYGNQRRLEYDFVVSPGADPRVIKLKLAGADHLKINDSGDLLIDIAGETVTLHKPFLYQVADNGERQEIAGRYVIKGNEQVTFDVAKFDAQKPLVIDPILVYSTEIGSGGHDYASGIAVDSSGNAYITGVSNTGGFPTTPGSLKPTGNGGNAFVTKLNPEGTGLVYSTYLGGGGPDTSNGIAVDESGSAYVAGYTLSSNFPTVNAARGSSVNLLRSADAGDHWVGQIINSPLSQIMVFAVDPIAPETIYAGGSLNNVGGIYKSTDGGKNWTSLNTGLANAYCSAIVIDPSTPSTIYASLTSYNSTGSGVYKSVDGGNNWVSVSSGLNSSAVSALAIDPQTPSTLYAGSSFLGMYKSTNGGASWSPSSNGITYGGFYSIVVDPVIPTTVYASAGGGGVFKTTNGGANWSQTNAGLTSTTVRKLAIDPTSTTTLYAGTAGGGMFKSTNAGGNWAAFNTGLPANTLVTSLSMNPAAPATIYIGTASGRMYKTVDGANSWNKIYETLTATSVNALAIIPGTPLTILAGTYTGSSSNDYEGFVSKLNPQGSALIYSTYLGGSGHDFCQSIAVDSGGSAYVTGRTASSSFTLANAFQSTLKGQEDAFVARFDPAGALAYSTYLGGSSSDSGYGIAVDSSGFAYVTGTTSSSDYPLVNPIVGATGGIFVTKVNQNGTGLVYSTRLGNGTGYGIAVDGAGNAYVTGNAFSGFPTTTGAFQTTYGGGCCGSGADDAFVSKINSSGHELVYSTYLGGAGAETGRGIALDSSGNAYVTGSTDSVDYPLVAGALRTKSPFFKSANAGAKWNNDNYGLKGEIVTTLAVDPKTPSTIYAGTRTGIFKSTDGGNNWNAINSGLSVLSIVAVVVDPVTPSTLYLTPGNGVYKSTDGGSHWSPVNNGLTNLGVQSLTIDPVTSSTLYLGTYGGPIFKTIDGAATWTRSSDPQTLTFVVSIAIDPVTPTTIYAAADMSNGGIFKSTDGGSSWQRTAGAQIEAYGRSVAVNPANPSIVFASGNGGLFKSTNGGGSWTLARSQSGSVVLDPVNPSTVYLLTGWEGIQKSTDGGDSWSPINNGLTYLNATSLVVNPLRPATVYVGSQIFPSSSETFVTKLNSNGSALTYSTLIGNSQGTSIAVDSAGGAYVAGSGAVSGFPVTPEAFQPFNAGFTDAFVTKLAMSYIISGQVLDSSGSPISDAEVTLSGGQLRSVLTGSDGTYQFTQLPEGGSFTVSVAKAHYSFTPPSQSLNNLNSHQTVNFTAASTNAPFYTISGHVTTAGNNLGGVAVALGGSQIGLTTTDSSGNYSFTVPGGGNYTITPSILGFSLTPGNQVLNNLSANQTADFNAIRQSFVVTNTNDHGAGSLPQAILDANATAGADTITFNIPGSGVQTIASRIALPDITDPVTIDGTTQPGFAGTPIIELSGSKAPSGDGLKIVAGNSTVRGLVINSFQGHGISMSTGGGNVIQGNYIGLDPTGTIGRPNHTGMGVYNSSNNIIGGTTPAARNVISSNVFDGMDITASSGNQVQGNFIGTNAAGTAARGNGIDGLEIGGAAPLSSGNLIGGTAPGAGNLISGNQNGIIVMAPGNTIQGNLIGTDVTGTQKVGNGVGVRASGANSTVGGTTPGARNIISGNSADGVTIGGVGSVLQGNYVGTDITGTKALGNGGSGVGAGNSALVGGTTPEARNIISANGGFGNLSLGSNSSGDGAIVQGNYIGTDVSGNVALDNPFSGITIFSLNSKIGGPAAGARNIISGNKVGIQIGGFTTATVSGNMIQGNYIGLNASGNAALPNTQVGIAFSTAADNIIGGTGNGEGNVIAFSGDAGVAVASGTGNVVRGNSIFSNGKLGIDLGFNGITLNDQGDADTGANNLQNFPVLTSATSNGAGTSIQGTLNSKANTTYDIDFYSNASCDPSGNGEGARFFASAQVTTDASGNASINVTFPETLPANRTITATATDSAGNTSEFSPCNSAETAGSVEFSAASYNVLEDVGSVTVTVMRTGGSKGQLAVNYTTGDITATAGADYTAISGTLVFADGETSKTFSIAIANDGVTEPDETLRLTLSGVADVEVLGVNSAVNMTIQASSTPLSISGTPVTVAEGNSGTTSVLMTINLSAATGRTVVANYSTSEGNFGVASARAGVDYQPVSGKLTFAPGVTSQTITVPIIGDTLDELDEPFFMTLSFPDGISPTPSSLITIIDDDPQTAAASINDVNVIEGNAGTTNAVFTVSLSNASGKVVRVNYTTANGTATEGSDYALVTRQLIFNPGETTKSVTVPVNGDVVDEPDETFFVNLTGALNAGIARASGKGTILNDDAVSTSPILILDESGPEPSQAAAIDSILFLRDPFPVVNEAFWWNPGADHNTRVAIFVANLQLAAGETSSSVVVNLTDSNSQGYDVAAEDVRIVPGFSFTQVIFRLPDNLAPGVCTIKVKAHGLESNSGTIRIRS